MALLVLSKKSHIFDNSRVFVMSIMFIVLLHPLHHTSTRAHTHTHTHKHKHTHTHSHTHTHMDAGKTFLSKDKL